MKKYALPLLLIFSLAINMAVGGTIAYTFWQKRKWASYISCNKGPYGQFLRKDLHLEEKKAIHLESLLSQDRKNLKHFRDKIHEQQRILINLLAENEIDYNKIDHQIEKMTTLRSEMEKVTIKRIIDIKSYLSEKKQREFLKFIRQRAKKRALRGSFGPGRGKKRR